MISHSSVFTIWPMHLIETRYVAFCGQKDQIVTKIYTIPRGRSSCVWTSSPINVCIEYELVDGGRIQVEAKFNSTMNVTNDPFEGRHVLCFWIMHKDATNQHQPQPPQPQTRHHLLPFPTNPPHLSLPPHLYLFPPQLKTNNTPRQLHWHPLIRLHQYYHNTHLRWLPEPNMVSLNPTSFLTYIPPLKI